MGVYLAHLDEEKLDHNLRKPIKVSLLASDYLTQVGLSYILELTTDIEFLPTRSNSTFENGEDIPADSPDIVLFDFCKTNRIHNIDQLLAKYKQPKIVILSDIDDLENLNSCPDPEIRGYCLRDATPQRLVTAIRSVYSGEYWIDAGIARELLDRCHKIRVFNEAEDGNAGEFPIVLDGSDAESSETSALAENISKRELQILHLLVQGLTNRQIACRLSITTSTAKSHVHRILEKLDVSCRTQATVKALQLGIVKL